MAGREQQSRLSNRVKVVGATATALAGIVGTWLAFGASVIDLFGPASDKSESVSSAPASRSVSWAELQPYSQETFDQPELIPEELWEEYRDDKWLVTFENRSYCYASRFSNKWVGSDYVVQRRTIGPAKIPQNAEYPVSVEVTVTDTIPGGEAIPGRAGLLYRSDIDANEHYAFELTQSGEVYLEKFSAQGPHYDIYTDRPSEVKVGKSNKLGLIGKGNTLYLYVNDTLIKTIEDKSVQGGYTGVIATNVGKFCFDNFTIYKNVSNVPQ